MKTKYAAFGVKKIGNLHFFIRILRIERSIKYILKYVVIIFFYTPEQLLFNAFWVIQLK